MRVGILGEGAVAYVAREMGFAQRIAERVVLMDGGENLEDVPKAQFFAAPSTERARQFLGKVLSH